MKETATQSYHLSAANFISFISFSGKISFQKSAQSKFIHFFEAIHQLFSTSTFIAVLLEISITFVLIFQSKM
ncbi:MAG: hypothetical protein LBU14_03905 [Candidatus Peribacteria bacterium]|nr:hypothetical protein [Candidatus Peribacteria bacterium]